MINRFIIPSITYLALFISTNLNAQSITKWEVTDISFQGPSSTTPFDIQFGAIFTDPDGRIVKIPGFYNGEREYVVRFSPDKQGEWSFLTYSSDKSLSGKKGKVVCTESDSNNHGPIIISKKDPKYFSYEDGTPYFLLAFECDWLFALDLDNPADIPKTKILVDQMAENGLNHVVMNVYAHDVVWKKDPDLPVDIDFGNPALYPFGGSNENPDFSVLNPVFFQRLDRVISYLNHKGIVSHLMIYVWNKEVNWPGMYTMEDDMYFDYVIARYQAYPNIVWDISKEALSYGRCDTEYVIERINRLRKQDAYMRLMTVHDYGFCSKHPEFVDFISIQTWRTDLYANMRKIHETYSMKPVFNIEHGGYEKGPFVVFNGDYIDAVKCLERNYECAFGGVYSTYYWQNTSWNVIIHDPMSLDGTDKPKFSYYKNLSDLFIKYPFHTLTPANDSSSGLCLKNVEDDLYLFYLPADTYATHVHVDQPNGTKVNETWFNPLTGVYMDNGVHEFTRWEEHRSPWEGISSVLILEVLK